MTRVDVPEKTKSKIDPRLRARRIAVQRDLGRRRRQRLLALLATLAIVGLGWALTRSALLDVDRVAVEGATHTGVGAVIDASGVERGEPLLYVDLADVRRGVASLPWVASVDAERRWFGTLAITIVERLPAAVLPARGGGWAVADGDGRLLATTPERPPGLPIIEGGGVAGGPGEAAPDEALGALQVAAALPDALHQRIHAVGISKDGSLRLRVLLGEGHVVEARLGPPEDVTAKLLSLTTLLDEADLAGVRVIDLRVPSVPTVSRG